MDGRGRSGGKEQKRTLEGWQGWKGGDSTKGKGREKGSGALKLRGKESEASTGLPEGPAATVIHTSSASTVQYFAQYNTADRHIYS